MSRFNVLKTTTKEIIELATRYEVLADRKSKLFCKSYLQLKNTDETDAEVKSKLLNHLCSDYGVRTDKLFNKVCRLLGRKGQRFTPDHPSPFEPQDFPAYVESNQRGFQQGLQPHLVRQPGQALDARIPDVLQESVESSGRRGDSGQNARRPVDRNREE
jgi:hypothetical protein